MTATLELQSPAPGLEIIAFWKRRSQCRGKCAYGVQIDRNRSTVLYSTVWYLPAPSLSTSVCRAARDIWTYLAWDRLLWEREETCDCYCNSIELRTCPASLSCNDMCLIHQDVRCKNRVDMRRDKQRPPPLPLSCCVLLPSSPAALSCAGAGPPDADDEVGDVLVHHGGTRGAPDPARPGVLHVDVHCHPGRCCRRGHA